jgi:hypothetical protein
VYFSPDELGDLERAIKRLILAAQDMYEVRAAADFLRQSHDLPVAVVRALETAIPVAYARPWGKRRRNAIGGLEAHWLPTRPDLQTAHKKMFRLRNKVYAHTDEEEIEARWIYRMNGALRPSGFVPAVRPSNPDLLDPLFTELAESQEERFGEGIRELQRRLASLSDR